MCSTGFAIDFVCPIAVPMGVGTSFRAEGFLGLFFWNGKQQKGMCMKKVVIFNYFINNKYNFTQNIVDWYNSMKKNYLVDCERQFAICTDNPSVKEVISDGSVQFIDVNQNNTKNIEENKRCKFKYILDYLTTFNPDFDYFSFIQSNARCIVRIPLSEIANGQDFIVCKHMGAYAYDFSVLYGNVKGSVSDTQGIDTSKFTYLQNCHFLAKKNALIELCSYINRSVEKDREKGIFTKWYDETYFNFYFNQMLRKSELRVNIIDGRTYAHTLASWAWRVNKDSSFRVAIEMIDKKQPYKNVLCGGIQDNGKQIQH